MRIARVLTRLNLGGPARQVLASDPRLIARGHQLMILTGRPEPGEGNLLDAARAAGLDVIELPQMQRRPAPWRDWRAGRAIERALTDFRPDVVHTHASKAGALGRRAATRAVPGAKIVHTFHGHVLEGYFRRSISAALAASERRLAQRTDAILAVSERTRSDLERLSVCAADRVQVVPPGIDSSAHLALPAAATRRRARAGAPFTVGVVGRLAPIKRPELALDAFLESRAAREHGARIVFVGDGELRSVVEARRSALPMDLAGRIELAGARPSMLEELARFDAILLTSANEGAPVALIEAGAAALPSVAISVGGVAEVVEHGRTGWLVEPASMHDMRSELAERIDALAFDASLRDAFGLAARERVIERHSAETLTDRLESIYSRLIGTASA